MASSPEISTEVSPATQSLRRSPARRQPYVGRAAICFMAVGPKGNDAELYNRLIRILKDDSRVENVEAASAGSQAFRRPVLTSFGSFVDDESVDEDEAPDPFSHLHAFRFSRPIVLQVRSPRRLQRKFGPFQTIPADRYWAAWDGLTLVVLWKVEEPEAESSDEELDEFDFIDSLSPSGGLLVQDILNEAAEKCETDFHVVACSSECDYTFAHSTLLVKTIGNDGETHFDDEEDGVVHVDLAAEHTPASAVEELHDVIEFSVRAFANLRSDVKTMAEAADLAREDVTELLHLNYERAALSAKPVLKSLPERWKTRKWRSKARQLVARICLDLATLEHVRSDWIRMKHIYDDSARDHNVKVVFENEYDLGLNVVSTLEVSEARSAIDRVTNSLDMRSLILATALGAIFGALIGAVVGSLL